MSDEVALQIPEQFSAISVYREPEEVLAEASKAAKALTTFLSQKRLPDGTPKKPVEFNGQRYMENEDWVTLAKFYGVISRIKKDSYLELGTDHNGDPIRGYEAYAEAYHVASDRVIATAVMMCLSDEENWGKVPKYEWVDIIENGKPVTEKKEFTNKTTGKKFTKVVNKRERKLVGATQKPLFQLRSMAQTRASSKVLSLVFKWVVVLAGYNPTPAEEVDEQTVGGSNEDQWAGEDVKNEPPSRKEQPKEAPKTDDPDLITVEQRSLVWELSYKAKLSREEILAKLKAEFKNKAGEPLTNTAEMLAKDFQRYVDSLKGEEAK